MLEITPAKYSAQLLFAVENTLKAHNLRLKPGQNLESVADAITSRGFKLSAEHGYLDASQNVGGFESPAHVNAIFEGLAKLEPTRFFPRELGGVVARDQMDTAGKMAYLKEFGLKAFEKLPATGNPNRPTVLSPDMTRAQYLSLDLATKSELCGTLGAAAIAKIMNRR
jgi:hypothetical protein